MREAAADVQHACLRWRMRTMAESAVAHGRPAFRPAPALGAEMRPEASGRDVRGEACAYDRRVGSLRERVLVSQHTARVEVLSLQDAGNWRYVTVGPGERAAHSSLDASFTVDDLHADHSA